MYAVIAVLGVFALLFLVVGIIFILVHDRAEGAARLRTAERSELDSLRVMRDELLMKAIDSVEVEPFAVEVLNIVRDQQRSLTTHAKKSKTISPRRPVGGLGGR